MEYRHFLALPLLRFIILDKKFQVVARTTFGRPVSQTNQPLTNYSEEPNFLYFSEKVLTGISYYMNILSISMLIDDKWMLSTVEAAKHIGVSKSTLLQWLDEGLVDDVERDWRDWRIWRRRDIERVKAFQKAYYSKPIRRVRRSALSRAECAKAAAHSMGGFAKGYILRPGVGM